MPEYIAIIICVYILALTGLIKRPCAAMGITLMEACYILMCVIALSVFQLRIGMEVSINLGALVLAFMPGTMMRKTGIDSAGIGAVMLIAAAVALMKHSGEMYGAESGLLCGLMADMAAFMYADNPSAAAYAVGSIPLITSAMETVVTLVFSGYASVEMGHDVLLAQLTAISISSVIIWIHSLLPRQAGAE